MWMFSWVGWMRVMSSGMLMQWTPSLPGCTSVSRNRKRANLRGRCTRRLCASSRAEQRKIWCILKFNDKKARMMMSIIQIHSGYIPGAIGRVVELHATYYAQQWSFGLFFEAKVATNLASFLSRFDEKHDGFWIAVY